MADDDNNDQSWVLWLLLAILIVFVIFLFVWWMVSYNGKSYNGKSYIRVIDPDFRESSSVRKYDDHFSLRKPNRVGVDDMWKNAYDIQRENIQSQIDDKKKLNDQKIAEDKRLELLLDRNNRITARRNREEKQIRKKEKQFRHPHYTNVTESSRNQANFPPAQNGGNSFTQGIEF
jgi:hypothetical protein